MAERPEDLNLPNSVVARIIKEALPDGVNVSKDARLAISKAASVFVLYATSCANNFAMQSKRKTISGTDVIEAMEEMEFAQFVDPLKKSLEAFKKDQKGKKEAAEKKKKEKVDSEQDGAKDGDQDTSKEADAVEDEMETIEEENENEADDVVEIPDEEGDEEEEAEEG